MNFKIFYLLFCLIFFFLKTQAQDDFCSLTDSLNAKSHFVRAQILYREGKLAESVSFFNKAKNAYQKIGCTPKVFLMNRNILKVHLKRGDVRAFNILFSKSLSILKAPLSKDDATYKGRVLLLKSNMYLSQKQLDSALVYGRKAGKIHKQHASWKYYVRDMNHLALVAYYQQDFVGMEDYIDNSFNTYRLYLKDKNKTLQGIMKLYGALYYKTGNYEQALKKTSLALDVALEDMQNRNDTVFVARCYNNIGLFYIELGDIYKAEDYCKNALQLYKKLGDNFEAATTYLNLGEFFAQQGKSAEALAFYKEGIKSLKSSHNIPLHELDKSSVNMYNGIGDVATQLGHYKEAFKALKKSLKIHESEESKKDETFSVLGMYYNATKRHEKATEYYRKSLNILKKLYGDNHPKIATAYFDLGQTEYLKNNFSKAIEYYDTARSALHIPFLNADSSVIIADNDDVSDKSVLLDILEAKSRLFFKNNNTLKAYNMAQAAVLLLEKMRNSFKEEGSKLFMLQKMIPTYELSIGLALELYQKTKERHYIEEAFQLVEKSKAMLLLDALKTEEARHFGNVPKNLLDEERRLAREIVRYEKLLFEAKTSRNENEVNNCQKELLNLKHTSGKLQSTLEKDYPKYHELKYNTKTASLIQVQKSLDDKTALIEYFVGNDNIYIFGIYKDTVWLTAVPLTNQFMVSVKGLRSSLTDVRLITNNLDEDYLLFAKNARIIYQKYLEPALGQNGITRLMFVPDGLLNYVPFDVLLTEKPDFKKTDFKKLPYLIKNYNINYHYSSSLMLFSRPPPQTNGQMLAMASSYDKNKFKNMTGLNPRNKKIRIAVSDLPGAKKEVEYLSHTFDGKFLYAENANEAAFKLLTKQNNYSIIHLAMHGVVDAKQPEYSSLVFSYTGQKEDDLLHAYELNLLEFNTELVVLSACETGFGKYERGEGVVSLGRGFMYAGAPSMVMTLWPINDKATSVLISNFYTQLASGYDKDEAMRIAKLSYIESSSGLSSHPFFWASFINLGDYHHICLHKHWCWWQYLLAATPFVLGFAFLFYHKFVKDKQ
jgi:CHAT domain-containing protein